MELNPNIEIRNTKQIRNPNPKYSTSGFLFRYWDLFRIRISDFELTMSHPANKNYFAATLHPVSSALFVLPLLGIYEGGMLWLGASAGSAPRNGADSWLRWALELIGLRQLYLVPAVLGALLLAWAWLRRSDRPGDPVGTWTGMVLESAAYALGLWGISLGLRPVLESLGVLLATGSVEPAFEEAIGFVGAGIYEEVLFRLVLFSGLLWLLKSVDISWPVAFLLAAGTSAALFSGAHHLGPQGETFNGHVFLFRAAAGLYFTVVYQLRGFGITVGTHACYDLLVGVLLPSIEGK
jgi:hypothetical protein